MKSRALKCSQAEGYDRLAERAEERTTSNQPKAT
jgi:hypothetical protein